MAQDKILSDYSGGMNALAAVDKLDPKECLLAENVRLDETGNIQSAGAFTHQNTSAYGAAAGNAGQWRTVNDSTAIATEGQTCAGGGTLTAAAFSNGVSWKCF